jgi:hypothetical protein
MTYAQAFATALGIYADTRGLGGQAVIDGGYATRYGFNTSVDGGGASAFSIGSNTSAFPSMGSAPTVSDILETVNNNFNPSYGSFYGGSSTKTWQANAVLNGINSGGDIALVNSDSAVTGDDQPLATSLHPLLTGTITVAVDTLSGPDAAAEQARIDDAIAILNATLAPQGLTLVEVPGGAGAEADVHLHLSDTSTIGGAANGVLGVTQAGGEITIVTGWNYFLGSDPAAMAAGQYDFETVVMHELGHAVGLGHSQDGNSVMFPTLGTDQSRRDLTAADLGVIEQAEDGSAEPLLAAPMSQVSSAVVPVASSSAAPALASAPASQPVGNTLWFAPTGTAVSADAPAVAPAPKAEAPDFDFDALAALAQPVEADAAVAEPVAVADAPVSDAYDILGLGGPWGA